MFPPSVDKDTYMQEITQALVDNPTTTKHRKLLCSQVTRFLECPYQMSVSVSVNFGDVNDLGETYECSITLINDTSRVSKRKKCRENTEFILVFPREITS